VADSNKTPMMLLDELAALNPTRRRELAAALRGVAETLAEAVSPAGSVRSLLRRGASVA